MQFFLKLWRVIRNVKKSVMIVNCHFFVVVIFYFYFFVVSVLSWGFSDGFECGRPI